MRLSKEKIDAAPPSEFNTVRKSDSILVSEKAWSGYFKEVGERCQSSSTAGSQVDYTRQH